MSSVGLLFIFVAFGFLYFVLVRPQRRRRVEQERVLSSVQPGDEILTAGGIYGSVTRVDGDEVTVEIAPGTEVRIARRAVAGIVPQDDEEAPDSDEEPDALATPDADEEPAELSDEPAEQAAEPDRA